MSHSKKIFIKGLDFSDIERVKQAGIITRIDSKGKLYALADQPPKFKDIPLTFCSFFCKGYASAYKRQGVLFSTEAKPVYACPADSIELMRQGDWIPGHEKYLLDSVDDLICAFPASTDFRKDFANFFSSLDAGQIFSSSAIDKKEAELYFETDYCLKKQWLEHEDAYNEVTFENPVKINVISEYQSLQELAEIMEKIG